MRLAWLLFGEKLVYNQHVLNSGKKMSSYIVRFWSVNAQDWTGVNSYFGNNKAFVVVNGLDTLCIVIVRARPKVRF